MAKSVEKRKNLSEILTSLIFSRTNEDWHFQREPSAEKKRELIEEGVLGEKLKNRNFELFNDGEKAESNGISPPRRAKFIMTRQC